MNSDDKEGETKTWIGFCEQGRETKKCISLGGKEVTWVKSKNKIGLLGVTKFFLIYIYIYIYKEIILCIASYKPTLLGYDKRYVTLSYPIGATNNECQ